MLQKLFVDETATEDETVFGVDYAGLSRCGSALRLVKDNGCAVVTIEGDFRRGKAGAGADFHKCGSRRIVPCFVGKGHAVF